MLLVAAQGSSALASAPELAIYAPPHAQLLLVRTLYRPLADGKAIITRRSYAVRIVPDGAGYQVDGELVETTVDAPPSLTALAEIERRRPDIGLFPIMLDGQGQIRGGGNVQSDGSLGRAATIAAETIGRSALSASDMVQAQSFVKQLAGRNPRSLWPADVFNPTPGKRDESRVIALPGGSEGRVTIEIAAQTGDKTDQLALLERVVTTDIGGDTRITRERWQLSRMPGSLGR